MADNINLTQKERELLLQDEIRAIAYWDVIIKDANITIPKWRVDAQKEYDLFSYEFYRDNNKWPTAKERGTKWKIIKAKHKK
jgi:hypothetical protein